MVRHIHAHRHIKNLCRFFGNMRNTFEVLDGDVIAVTSGCFCGLRFAFEPGVCSVSNDNYCVCFDVRGEFPVDALIRMLFKHCLIKDVDFLP